MCLFIRSVRADIAATGVNLFTYDTYPLIPKSQDHMTTHGFLGSSVPQDPQGQTKTISGVEKTPIVPAIHGKPTESAFNSAKYLPRIPKYPGIVHERWQCA